MTALTDADQDAGLREEIARAGFAGWYGRDEYDEHPVQGMWERAADAIMRGPLATLRARATAAEDQLKDREAEIERLRALPTVEFHQQDWIPGFAAFLPGATTPQPDSRAYCVLNLGSMLSTVAHDDVPVSDLPGFIVESMIHEVGHVLEQWADVEFSEERVEALCEHYRAALASTEPQDGGNDGA